MPITKCHMCFAMPLSSVTMVFDIVTSLKVTQVMSVGLLVTFSILSPYWGNEGLIAGFDTTAESFFQGHTVLQWV